MESARGITLLHLSDVQFGPHHRFEGGGALGSLLERLRQDLDPLCQAEGLRPDLIVLTGDLAEYGKRSEFEQVQRFAQTLAGLLELPPRRVVLVPGNHDINWKASESYFSAREADEVEPVFPYFPKLRHYADFFARFYEGETTIRFTEEEPWSFFEYPELKVVVAGLNSAMAESHRGEDHYGFIGEQQLRDFAAKLRPYKEQGFLRIGAVHHDVLHPENPKAAQDLKDLKRILGPYLNVVLHGHIHEEQLGWFDNTVPSLGIGSAGVKAAARPPEVPNQYQIVRVEQDRVRFGSRAYVPDQKRWIGDLRLDPEGKSWLVERKVAFERVEATFAEGGAAEATPAGDLARVVESYRQHVAALEGTQTLFDLIGFGEDPALRGGVNLLQIFVPQRAEPSPLQENRERGKEDSQTEERRRRVDMLSRSIEELLVDPTLSWVFLLGAPGAGKTAITRWLMLKLCASGEHLDRLSEDLVPVRIEMRLFDASYRAAVKRPYDFFAYLDETHGEKLLSLRGEHLHEIARAGRLLWIFDGLDEVVDPSSRKRYAEMITGLKREHPGCRGLITSRMMGAELIQPLLENAGLSTYRLLNFDQHQIASFLIYWHTAAFTSAPEVGQRRLERLLHALQESPALRELVVNPLLLTMISFLNRDEELPRRRHRLYQRLIERMVDQWDAGKQLALNASYQRFNTDDKLRFLRELAWEMMSDGAGGRGNLIEEEALLTFTRRFCEQIYGEEHDTARRTAERMVGHLCERHHVLTFLGGRAYSFTHRTFLEYLGAAKLQIGLRSGLWNLSKLADLFVERWDEAGWQETLMLTCALIQEDQPEHVISMLQRIPAQAGAWSDVRIMAYVGFAIRCLAEVDRLDRDPIRSFAGLLTEVLEDLILRSHHDALQTLQDEEVFSDVARLDTDQNVRAAAEYRLTTLKLFKALTRVGKPRRGRVRLSGRPVGIIEEAGTGSRFFYDPSYLTAPGARPIAPNIPLRKDPYESAGLHPFFDNLLPEGALLDQACATLNIARTDIFGLMLATCADCIGAVEVVPYDEDLPS